MGFIPILALFAICDSLLCLQELGVGFLLDDVGRRVCVTEEQCHRRDRHLVVAQKYAFSNKNALVWTGSGC